MKANDKLVHAIANIDGSRKRTVRQIVELVRDSIPAFDLENYEIVQVESAIKELNRRCEKDGTIGQCFLHFKEEVQNEDGMPDVVDFRKEARHLTGREKAKVIDEYTIRRNQMDVKRRMWIRFFDENGGRETYQPFLIFGID